MHDAVTRWYDVDIVKGILAPVDEVKTVIVTALFNRTVLLKGVVFEACVLNGQ